MKNHLPNSPAPLIAVAVGLTLASGASAAEKTIALKDAPAAVQKAVADQLKSGRLNALSVETEDGKTEYEAALTVDGREKTVVFDPAGKLLETETVVEFGKLPEAVRSGLTREAGKGSIAKIEETTSAGGTSYEALIKETGKKDREVVIGADGKPVPAKK